MRDFFLMGFKVLSGVAFAGAIVNFSDGKIILGIIYTALFVWVVPKKLSAWK